MRRRFIERWIAFALIGTAVLAGCSQPVTTPISQETVSNLPSYFWSVNLGTVGAVDTNASTNSLPSVINFKSASPGTLIVDNANTSTPLMQCIVNTDSVFAEVFSDSLFHFPDNSYFSALDTVVFDSVPLGPVILTVSSGNPITFVETDSGLYYVNLTQSSSSFASANLQGVTALAAGSDPSVVYAGLSDGTIMQTSTTAPTSWSPYSTNTVGAAITQMAVIGDTVYALVAGKTGIQTYSAINGWKTSPLFTTATVTKIGITSDDTTLFAASGTQISAYNIHRATLFNPVSANAGTVYCFANAGTEMFAGCDYGIFQWNESSNSWASVSSAPRVTSMSFNNSKLLYLSNGAILEGTISAPTPIRISTPDSLQQIGWNGSSPWLLTRYNFETMPSGGSTFTPVTGLPNGYWPIDSGGVVLLRYNLFSNDSSWRAGTLVLPSHQSWSLTARVLNHLDSLSIWGIHRTYPDVLMVRYANELNEAPNFNNLLYYWIVYYAKNYGPVMFDKITATGQIERTELDP